MEYQPLDIVAALLGEVDAALGTEFLPEHRRAVEMRIRREWGGQEVYVNKTDTDLLRLRRERAAAAKGGVHVEVAHQVVNDRAQAIKCEYNGKNRRELMSKWGIGKSQFYRDLKGG